MNRVIDKIINVTSGGRGVGQAICELLASILGEPSFTMER